MNRDEMIAKLKAIAAVLAEAHANCGGDADNIFAEPLEAIYEILQTLQ